MTSSEIQILIYGLLMGAQITNVAHVILDCRAVRRSLADSRQARRCAAGDHYFNSLRLYRIQHRLGARR
ncbi:hypothetical protein ACIQ6Y_15400 [Streptomyces sp. NPDC096205]|uniref:hypothetical protein n=1 Tax=Streptomyces sp. NPDC096205 TaxID=3366081 RepID=UPI0038261E79